MVVQEMADESQSLPGEKLKNVLDLEGKHDMDAISSTNGMVTRLKATIEVRYETIETNVRNVGSEFFIRSTLPGMVNSPAAKANEL